VLLIQALNGTGGEIKRRPVKMSDEKKMKSCKEVQDEIKKLKEDKKHFKDHNWYQLFGEEVGLKKGAELQLKDDIKIVNQVDIPYDDSCEAFRMKILKALRGEQK